MKWCVLCKVKGAVIHIGFDREPPYSFCLDCIKIDGQISDLITMAKQQTTKGVKRYIDGIGG